MNHIILLYKKFRLFKKKVEYKYRQHIIKEEFISFQCNICGKLMCAPLNDVEERETPSCFHCGSTLRFRSLMYALSLELFSKKMTLKDFPIKKDIVGIGMSDSNIYSFLLQEKLNYTNTFYHTEPLLNIVGQIDKFENAADFIISTDVFEHVPPPVNKAFTNMYKILKPGGVAIFSVPYNKDEKTIEHFPNLHNFKLVKNKNKYQLENITIDNQVEYFDNIVFHGGEGSTLEMRTFAENSLFDNISEAGFENIKVFNENLPDIGIINKRKDSLVLTMKKMIK